MRKLRSLLQVMQNGGRSGAERQSSRVHPVRSVQKGLSHRRDLL